MTAPLQRGHLQRTRWGSAPPNPRLLLPGREAPQPPRGIFELGLRRLRHAPQQKRRSLGSPNPRSATRVMVSSKKLNLYKTFAADYAASHTPALVEPHVAQSSRSKVAASLVGRSSAPDWASSTTSLSPSRWPRSSPGPTTRSASWRVYGGAARRRERRSSTNPGANGAGSY